MFYVYIIESVANLKWYYGFTQRHPIERLYEHNGNHHHFTANKGPWALIFIRAFETKKDAISFEKNLKSIRNKQFITRQYSEYFIKR